MKSKDVQYEELPNGQIIFRGIPDGDRTIDVIMRPLTRRDRDDVRLIQPDDPEALEKTIALSIVQWDNRPSVTSLDLMDESKDEAVQILTQALDTFFQTNYRFVPTRRN